MIVDKFIKETNELVKDKGIYSILTDNAKKHLVKKGFNRKMGARPLQRVIDNEIKKPMSKEVLFGDLVSGGKVTVDVVDGKITLSVESFMPDSTENEVENQSH